MGAIAIGAGSIAGTLIAASCSGTDTELAQTIASIAVSLGLTNLTVGQTVQAAVIARDASGGALNGVTITWSSSNSTVATVSSAGLVTAVAPGTAQISGSAGGQSGSVTVTVTVVPVAAVSVTLSANSAVVGQTVTASATTRDGGGAALTGRAITWSSSNTAVATVTSTGAVTAVAAGTANIIATSEGVTGSATLTVTIVPVKSVTVSLASAALQPGQSTTATATTRDASNNVLTGRAVTWSSSDITIATVNSSGAVTAVTAGSATITATSEGVSGGAALSVQATVGTVSVSLATNPITVTKTTTATATVRDGNGNVLTGRTVTWTSSNTAVATVSSTGVVTGVSVGSATISATADGVSGSASIAVQASVASVSVSFGSSSLVRIGLSTAATATVRDAASNVLTNRVATWTSSAPAVAAVGADGTVSGIAAGTSNIIATVEGVTGSATVTVVPATGGGGVTATQLAITQQPNGATSGASFTTPAAVEIRDANNAVVPGSNNLVTASIASGTGTIVSGATVAAVNGVAVFTNLRIGGLGPHTLTFTALGLTSATSASFTVAPAPPTHLTITTTPNGAVTGAPFTTQPVVELRDAGNALVPSSTAPVTVAISGGAGVLSGTTTVNAVGGVATFAGLTITGPGSVTLLFTSPGLTSASAGLTVLPTPPTQLAIATQPVGAVSGSILTTQPVIQVRDANNALVTGSTASVTAAISSGNGVLVGLATVNAVNGVATFTNLRVDGSGAQTLIFTSAPLTPATSAPFTVNPALATTQAVPSVTGTTNTAIPPFTPVTASGGTPPYSFALTGGSLPVGMTFNNTTGQIGGTPTTALATTVFTVTVTDAALVTSSKTFTLTVTAPLGTTQAVPTKTGTTNVAIPAFTPVTASGGTPPYTFALTGGTLPTGMNFNTNTGQITGTPTTPLATTVFTVTVTDALAANSAKTFQLTVNPPLIATTAVPSVTGNVGTLIPSFTPVTIAGGTTPYTFALTGGTLPGGMNFNTNTGQITGTPTTALALTTFTVTATDAVGATAGSTFTLTVNGPLTTTQAVPTKVTTVNVALTFTPVTASGGTAPYTFALTGGALPTGMNFNTNTGQITGTPTVALAQTTFTVTVTDVAAANSAKTFQFTVNSAVVATTAVPSVTGTAGAAIPSFTPVTGSGGTTPYTFALSGGTLPTGMNFNTNTGQITGTPTVALAQTTFTVTVTDAVTANAASTFSLTVNPALTTTQAVPTKVTTVNVALASFTPVTAAGGTAPYTFALTGGALPTGMNFNTGTGLVSGTPTTSLAITTFTVTATDAASATSNKTFQLTVNSAVVATQAVPSVTGTVNVALTAVTPVTATGGTAPLTFALSGGVLPTGMNFNTNTGQLTGTPTTSLAATVFTVTVTDALGSSNAKTFSLTVNAGAVPGIKLNVTASPTATLNGGTDLSIPILLDLSNRGTDDLGSITVTISWDPTKFTFKSQSAGAWVDSNGDPATVLVNTANTGTGSLAITGFSTSATLASFTLRNLVLTANATATTVVTPVTANVSVAANAVATTITVTPRNLSATINP